ncbi:MAG: Hsp20/alpha crystallin family protein [Planctomycetes bacterium]|nr:Hsp20/alpha crystallin family protein [Planctomycetota bacterium]
MSPARHSINQHTKGISHGLGGFREIVISSNKLVMMYSEHIWHPPTDVYETSEEIIIKCEISGISQDDIAINIEENKVVIKGIRSDCDKRPKRVFKQMEINYGALERVIALHGYVEPEHAYASYRDGFLELVIPKNNQPSSCKTKQIKIKK